MIDAVCFTNLDGYNMERWPARFPAVPHVGNRVAAESGRSLAIVALTWVQPKGALPVFLRVELHR